MPDPERADPLPLLSQRQAAQQLGVHVLTFNRYVRQGLVPVVQVGGRTKVDPDVVARIRREGLQLPERAPQ